jgi:3D (Asp-Asp-Asp) domain-containing protein
MAWIAVAGLAALARLDEGLRATTDGVPAAADSAVVAAGADEWHEPVRVVGEWQHAPVAIVAARPPSPPRVAERPRPKPGARELPRPFAALRLASSGLIMPRLALPRVLSPRLPALRSLLTRARPGEPVHVRLSAYCLRGRTRRGTHVRPGIIAADPRVFPLARHVELYAAGRYLGRFKVEDTGSAIKGTRIDIWTPDCNDAVRFGMRDGVAQLVARGDD